MPKDIRLIRKKDTGKIFDYIQVYLRLSVGNCEAIWE